MLSLLKCLLKAVQVHKCGSPRFDFISLLPHPWCACVCLCIQQSVLNMPGSHCLNDVMIGKCLKNKIRGDFSSVQISQSFIYLCHVDQKALELCQMNKNPHYLPPSLYLAFLQHFLFLSPSTHSTQSSL